VSYHAFRGLKAGGGEGSGDRLEDEDGQGTAIQITVLLIRKKGKKCGEEDLTFVLGLQRLQKSTYDLNDAKKERGLEESRASCMFLPPKAQKGTGYGRWEDKNLEKNEELARRECLERIRTEWEGLAYRTTTSIKRREFLRGGGPKRGVSRKPRLKISTTKEEKERSIDAYS